MTIFHQVIIDANPETIFKAISEQQGLSKWWLQDCTVKSELGFTNTFRVAEHIENRMKIVDFQPSQRVEWQCVLSAEEWIGTHIIFEISAHGKYSKLDFKHEGWKEQGDFFATCNFHWARHLMMLRNFCESGLDQINPDVEKGEMDRLMG